MADNTGIEWATHTWSPWTGCTKVSPACDHCYAEAWAKRSGHPELWQGQLRRTSAAYWQKPFKWDREAAVDGERPRIFPSLCDPFDNQAPARWRDDFWHRIEQTPHLDWLLLTKRPQNIAKMLPDPRTGTKPWGDGWPNVWLGTTAENQEEADRRIPHLLSVPARVRFLSCEPLLAPVDLTRAGYHKRPIEERTAGRGDGIQEFWIDALRGTTTTWEPYRSGGWGGCTLGKLDLVIAGGESGRDARPMHPDWARKIRDDCAAAGVPFFFKQWGEWAPGENVERQRGVVQTATWWQLSRLRGGGADSWSFDHEDLAIEGGHRDDEPDLYRVGKKTAGRQLDGRTWDEFPERPAP